MKKLFMLLPIAALMFASCSSENDEQIVNTPTPKIPDGAIWFSSGVEDLTRATTTMSNFTEFKVTGVHANDDYSFSNLLVSRNANSTIWTYAATEDDYKYWPTDNSDIAFFAYAPTNLSGLTIDKNEQVMTGFTQQQVVANQIDVLAAAAIGNKANNASSGVSLDFKHALSQIEIKAKNSAASTYKVVVLGVKLCRVKNTGDMSFQDESDAYPVWANLGGSASYIVKGSTAMEMTSSAQSIMFGSDNFLMLPQQLIAWSGSETDETGAYLSVLCQIYKKEGGDWVQKFPDTADKYAFSSVPISTKWEPGHKYVYTLDFFGAGGGAGQYDPEPTNPEVDPGSSQVDEDIDPTPAGDPDPEHPEDTPSSGDPIIPEAKAPIKFTVTITDWINGAGDNEKLNL